MTQYALVSPARLSEHLDGTGSLLVDTRPGADYWHGHLQGARHIDAALLSLLRTDPASVKRFQDLLAWMLSTTGVTADRPVLLYGAANEVNVSRVAWALGYAGVAQIHLLDGGLTALDAPAITQEAPALRASHFALHAVDRFLASAQDAARAGQGDAATLIDAREREEFIGLRSNARRNGRIPGALHWDTRHELDGQGRFQPVAALARDFAEVAQIADPARPLVAYCGGGGRAARTFVALQLAGHRQAAVYPASWNEWGNQDHFAIETGEPEKLPA